MAFVSAEHELLFIHITKNGGTSVCEALSRAHGKSLNGGRNYAHEGVGNSIPDEFKPHNVNVHDTYGQILSKCPDVAKYRKFAIIRNPWARIFSFYQHKVRRGDKDLPKGPMQKVMRQSNVLLLQPQLWWLHGADDVDLIEFNGLSDGFNDLMSAYGVPVDPLPHLNKTTNPADYREHYDAYTKDLVWYYYRHEIETYGWEF